MVGKVDQICKEINALTESEAKAVQTHAARVWWTKFSSRMTADHDRHRGKYLAEGCYRCFPLGERIGG